MEIARDADGAIIHSHMAVPAQYGDQISYFRIDVSSALSTSADFLYLLPAIAITTPVEFETMNINFIRGGSSGVHHFRH